MLNKKPILVTGSHRSGSTWVGKVIASSNSVSYIHEPFNLGCSPGICRVKFPFWFTYVNAENEEEYYFQLRDTLNFSYSIKESFLSFSNIRDVGRSIRDYNSFLKSQVLGLRPLMKDPIALFSAEWLVSRFDMDALILVRHPAAFVNSIMQKKWNFPFSHFLEQPLLIKEQLHQFEEQIWEYAHQEVNILDQSILLWKIFHQVILMYQEKHPNWLFLRHEDISSEPESQFQYIFNRLEIPYSQEVARMIRISSSPKNQVETTQNIHLVNRNSKLTIKSWKQHLSDSEVRKIRQGTEDIACNFYSDEDWN
jgi:hypothetical protein